MSEMIGMSDQAIERVARALDPQAWNRKNVRWAFSDKRRVSLKSANIAINAYKAMIDEALE